MKLTDLKLLNILPSKKTESTISKDISSTFFCIINFPKAKF